MGYLALTGFSRCNVEDVTWRMRVCVSEVITSNPSREGAAGDVLVVVFDQDAVVSGKDRQVGHGAGPVLVVQTADVCLGRTLNRQRQTTWKQEGNLRF